MNLKQDIKDVVCVFRGHHGDIDEEGSPFFTELHRYRCGRCGRLYWQYKDISIQLLDDEVQAKR